MDKSTLFIPYLEAQAHFQIQIDLQKLQEYVQRYKPADYKGDPSLNTLRAWERYCCAWIAFGKRVGVKEV